MSVVVCSFIDNKAQNTILRQRMQVEFYASHINTRTHHFCECRRISNSLSSRILLLDSVSGHFLLRSLCILFESMVFLIIQDLKSNRTQRVNVVYFENFASGKLQ